MKRLSLLFTILCLMVLSCQTAPTKRSEQTNDLKSRVITLEIRPGIEQKFIFMPADTPMASVILFKGGLGKFQLSSFLGKPTMKYGSDHFFIRTRKMFQKHGFMVAVVDAPYDRSTKSTPPSYRTTEGHVKEIKAVISFLKQKKGIPVWLIGHSQGTVSAAHLAINSNGQVEGLVLSSTAYSVASMDLEKIKIPTLIVLHKEDTCWDSPPALAEKVSEGLMNSPIVEIKYFSGGYPPLSRPCGSLSEHGYYGIEKKVVSAIADFIKSNSQY